MEVWKDVKDYEGFYQVSSLGRVKSLSRFRKNGCSGYVKKEIILKNCIDGHGYLVVGLSKNKKRHTKKVHQLVAIAFLNHTPNGYKGLIVDHVDNNRLNNIVDNLQLTTMRHNCSKDKKGKTSKYTGVSWYKTSGKWASHIKTNRKSKHLGYFYTETEASEAYQKAIKNI